MTKHETTDQIPNLNLQIQTLINTECHAWKANS